MLRWKEFIKEEKAAGVVEMILILVVLIGLVLIFKDQITHFISVIFDGIFKEARRLW